MSHSPRAPFIRALEPRLLYDGAAAVTAMDVATDQVFAGHHDTTPGHGERDARTQQTEAERTAKGNSVSRSPIARALEASEQARDEAGGNSAEFVAADAGDSSDSQAASDHSHTVSPAQDSIVETDNAQAGESAISIDLDALDDLSTLSADDMSGINADAAGRDGTSIVFVDKSLNNCQSLIDALDSDRLDIITVDADENGMDRMADVLQDRSDIAAVHVLSHGSDGQFTLGNATVNADNLDQRYADDLATISQAMTDGGDLLLYGCDTARGSEGEAFLDAIAAQTGHHIDIAGSDDLTGTTDHGGNWTLEYSTGDIEADTLAPMAWDGVLDGSNSAPEITTPDGVISGKEDTSFDVKDADGNPLKVSDADGDDLEVTLTVSHGTLTQEGNSGNEITLSGTSEEINTALKGLQYQGDKDYNGKDTLTVSISDGQTEKSQDVEIQVTPDNDAPELSPSKDLSVKEGGTLEFKGGTFTDNVFGGGDFGLTDVDLTKGDSNSNPQTLAQEVFQLESTPEHGTLYLDGQQLAAGSTFSADQVGDLKYVHDGEFVAKDATDSFDVKVNDGGATDTTTVTINLEPVNHPPEVTGNPEIFEGQDKTLGLSYSDSDNEHDSSLDKASDATFTITNVAIPTDQDGDPVGELYFQDGTEFKEGQEYSADKLAGLSFKHLGSEPDENEPSFTVNLTDNGGGTDTPDTVHQDVTITVKPNDDDPELVKNNIITVDGDGDDSIDGWVYIDNEHLQVTDNDNTAEDITYVVTDNTGLEHGLLQINRGTADNPEWYTLGTGEAGLFTQADIDNSRIRFYQTSGDASEDADTFEFEVYDGELKAWDKEGKPGAVRNDAGGIKTNTFEINLSNQAAGGGDGSQAFPTLGDLTLKSEGSDAITGDQRPREGSDLTVESGYNDATITSDQLKYVITQEYTKADDSTGSFEFEDSQIYYRLSSVPDNGELQIRKGEEWQTLSAYDRFTQEDVKEGNIRFVHDGGETHHSSFEYSVTAEGYEVHTEGEFHINVIPTNDRPTAGDGKADPVVEGGSIQFGTDVFDMGDADVSNEPGEGDVAGNHDYSDPDPLGQAQQDDLYFQITDLPEHGKLSYYKDGDGWTEITVDNKDNLWFSEDLLDGKGIQYTHDGTENHSDGFQYQVRDDLDSTAGEIAKNADHPLPVDKTYQGHLSDKGTVDLVITPLNDAPIIQKNDDGDSTEIDGSDGQDDANTGTSQNDVLELHEGETKTITNEWLNVVDQDTSAEVLQYRVTQVPEHGQLMRDGVVLGVGSRFTQADIDNDLLQYKHDGSEDFSDSFHFIVSDSVTDHVYSDGENPGSGDSVFTINVTQARNDTPTIENNVGNDGVVDLFNKTEGDTDFFTHEFEKGDIVITDPDLEGWGDSDSHLNEQNTIRVTLQLKEGDAAINWTDYGLGFGDVLDGNDVVQYNDTDENQVVLQGKYEEVQEALDHLSVTVPQIVDQDGSDNDNHTYKLAVSVDDRIYDNVQDTDPNGGANGDDRTSATENDDGTIINDTNNVDTTEITFRVSDDNDDPVITSPSDQTVDEDEVLNFKDNNALIQIADPDAFDSQLKVTLEVENGKLDTGSHSGSTIIWTGTLDEINDELESLTYQGDQDFHGDDTLKITVNDQGSNGYGGGEGVTQEVGITVNPVNDKPTLDIPETTVTLSEGNSIDLSGITITDRSDTEHAPFNDEQQLVIKVTEGSGDLLVDLSDVVLTSSSGNGSEEITLQGRMDALQKALSSLSYSPADSNIDRTDTVEIIFNDMGNGAADVVADGSNASTDTRDGDGVAYEVSGTVDVQVSGNNNAPIFEDGSPTSDDLSATEDLGWQSLSDNPFQFDDPDDFDSDMQVTVSVEHGELKVSSGDLQATSSNGTLVLTGTEKQLNTALENLQYKPEADYHGTDRIAVQVDDLGNTGVTNEDNAYDDDYDGTLSVEDGKVTKGDYQWTVEQSGSGEDASWVVEKTIEFDVNPVNDPPEMTDGPYTLESAKEDTNGGNGQALSDVLGLDKNYNDDTDDQETKHPNDGGDTSTGSEYIAIVGNKATSKEGIWKVKIGDTWTEVPSNVSDSEALIVSKDAEIRFKSESDYFGDPGELTVRVSDSDTLDDSPTIDGVGDEELHDLSGSSHGGYKSDSGRWSNTVTIETTIENVNDRPVWDGDSNGVHLEIKEDTPVDVDDAKTVGDLFENGFNDEADKQPGGDKRGDFGGIAIVGNESNSDQGVWQYYDKGESDWQPISADVSDSNALTLDADTKIRFKPAEDYNGDPGKLEVRLSDTKVSNAAGQTLELGNDDQGNET